MFPELSREEVLLGSRLLTSITNDGAPASNIWTTATRSVDVRSMALNDIAAAGAPLEVSFYDTEYDEEDDATEEEARDDFMMCFVGPTPAAIMQVQRDLLVEDVINLMERHFDGSELGGVVAEIDKLFSQRFDATAESGCAEPRGGGACWVVA